MTDDEETHQAIRAEPRRRREKLTNFPSATINAEKNHDKVAGVSEVYEIKEPSELLKSAKKEEVDVMMEDVGSFLHTMAAQTNEMLSQVRDKCQCLVNTAKQEASDIVSEAKKQAEAIKAAAKKEADALRAETEKVLAEARIQVADAERRMTAVKLELANWEEEKKRIAAGTHSAPNLPLSQSPESLPPPLSPHSPDYPPPPFVLVGPVVVSTSSSGTRVTITQGNDQVTPLSVYVLLCTL